MKAQYIEKGLRNTVISGSFLLSYFLLVFGQTLGYGSSNSFYFALTAFCCFLLMVCVLINSYTRHDLFVAALILCLGLISFLFTKKLTLLLSALFFISAKNISVQKIFKVFLCSRFCGFLILFLFYILNIFKVTIVSHFSPALGVFVTRFSINGVSTNILHLNLFSCFIVAIYLYHSFRKIYALSIMFIIDIVFYLTISRSSTGILVTSFSIILAALIYSNHIFKKLFNKYIFLFIPVSIVFFIATGIIYTEGSWVGVLNRLMTGRVAYNHYWLTNYGVTLFGVKTGGADAFFDNSVIYLIVQYGVVVSLILFFCFYKYLLSFRCSEQCDGSFMFFVFYLYSMSESFLPSAITNPALFLLLVVFDSSLDKSVVHKANIK